MRCWPGRTRTLRSPRRGPSAVTVADGELVGEVQALRPGADGGAERDEVERDRRHGCSSAVGTVNPTDSVMFVAGRWARGKMARMSDRRHRGRRLLTVAALGGLVAAAVARSRGSGPGPRATTPAAPTASPCRRGGQHRRHRRRRRARRARRRSVRRPHRRSPALLDGHEGDLGPGSPAGSSPTATASSSTTSAATAGPRSAPTP